VHGHCWLGVRKSIRPVKNWVIGCWCGYVSAARCRLFAYRPSDATASHPKTPSSLASFKSRLVLPSWYRLTQVVPEKRPLNGCSSSISSCSLCRANCFVVFDRITNTVQECSCGFLLRFTFSRRGSFTGRIYKHTNANVKKLVCTHWSAREREIKKKPNWVK